MRWLLWCLLAFGLGVRNLFAIAGHITLGLMNYGRQWVQDILYCFCFHAWPSFCSGCKRTPKSFDLLKIWATPLKIWVKSPKIRAKNGAQRCLTSENNTQRLQKNTIKTFSWRSHQKQVFMLFVGENVGNRRTKAIWASLGKFRQKFFAPPKICLLLHLCSRQRVYSNARRPKHTVYFHLHVQLHGRVNFH